jgi:nucleoside-diphosphate-sugar epimerase
LKDKKVLIVGCGDIGIALGLKLIAAGNEVWGLLRSKKLPLPLNTIRADVTQVNSLYPIESLSLDYVVVTLTPGEFNDEAYQRIFVRGLSNLLEALQSQPTIKRLFFVSSTSVYHQNDSAWVDEESAVAPTSFSGKRLLEAEQLLASSSLNYTVIRFAGIYGPGRRRLIDQVKAKQGCSQFPELYTNRIHRDDCVGFLAHLLSLDSEGKILDPCYLGVDSEPVTMWQLKRWLAQQVDIVPDDLEQTAITRRSSKRCSNRRLLATGYVLQYDSYRLGYGAVLNTIL